MYCESGFKSRSDWESGFAISAKYKIRFEIFVICETIMRLMVVFQIFYDCWDLFVREIWFWLAFELNQIQ